MFKQLNKKRNQKGFTLVELLVVVAIIGILAAIAIPQFNAYRVKAFNAAAVSDAKNAYTAGQAYFADNPGGTVTDVLLKANGYNCTKAAGACVVTLTITAATQATFALTAKHASGDKTYTIALDGSLTSA